MIFDPNRIEKELSDIMVRNSPTEARASLLNLVLFSTAERESQADSLLQAVLGRRAARVIHVIRTEDAQSQVSVSARCYLDHSNRSVCLQEVVISSGSDGIGGRISTWAPLLIRDIPVYVVWLDRISGEKPVPPAVIELADTLILDSEAALRSGEDSRELFAQLARLAHSEGTALCDLTWRRLTPLCGLTADCFDSPQMLQRLHEITSVTVSGGPQVFGRLFLAWFASRLDLRPVDGGESAGGAPDGRGSNGNEPEREDATAESREELDSVVRWDSRAAYGRPVQLIHRQPRPLDESMQIVIGFEDQAALRIRAVSGGCAEIEDEDGETLQVLQYPGDGEILLSEIDAMRHDHIYAQTLVTLDTFTEKPYSFEA